MKAKTKEGKMLWRYCRKKRRDVSVVKEKTRDCEKEEEEEVEG